MNDFIELTEKGGVIRPGVGGDEKVERVKRLEPSTSSLARTRSSQLSYTRIVG